MRKFMYDSAAGHHNFYPISWKDKVYNLEYLSGENNSWFEFCVNSTLIKSEDGGWKYISHKSRKLENGGREIVIILKGQEILLPQNRIQLHYFLQIFPDSRVIREKIELVPQDDKIIHLSKFENKIRMIFPKYDFVTPEIDQLILQEVQLAKWEGELMSEIDWSIRPNYRLKLSDGKSGRNLSHNHMYHPGRSQIVFTVSEPRRMMKGPIVFLLNKQSRQGIIYAYEHGSPDDDMSQNYIGIDVGYSNAGRVNIELEAIKGAYYDGEIITPHNPYSTVWADVGHYIGDTFDEGEANFWRFIYQNQSEHLAPRQPTIYYNTWGMQRNEQKETGKSPQEILTEERVIQEIECAHELSVDIFVIDDGWQKRFGDWYPITERFPNGFRNIKSLLDKMNMRLGIWLAAEGIDSNSNLYIEHNDWLVRNKDGTECIGRWKKPVGCFSSGYKNFFTELCKSYIDQGVTYFKWDGLDKNLCYATNHYHGNKNIDPEERAFRSGYDFILAITDVARELTEYNPEIVIVYDVTEKLRNVGLAFLSEARYFWMNNGATWYDDLSYYRTKSIRTVTNLYNQILPTVVQTSATYPHQSEMYGAMQYNINTTLLGGGGFWGNLSEIETEDRIRIGEQIKRFKQIARSVIASRPLVTGNIGSSPEVYEQIDTEKAEGQVTAFSGSAIFTDYYTQALNVNNFLCALGNAFELMPDHKLHLPLLFPQPDATNKALLFSNHNIPVRIESSTCWLKECHITSGKTLRLINGAPGRQKIIWSKELGQPEVNSSDMKNTEISTEITKDKYQIIIIEKIENIIIDVKPYH